MHFREHDPVFWLRAVLPAVLFLTLAIPALCQGPSDLVLVGGRVYPSPTATPIENAVVVIHDGKIAAIGKLGQVRIPKGSETIDCKGKIITAGFWNSHVHFTEDVWNGAATAPADKLESHMQEMLTRWGFTTVFDIGSDPRNTLPLRKRVESGELAGPKIYTTAGNIFPENGIPVYLPEELAKQLKFLEAATPADAARLAQQQLASGGDGIKLFTGAIMGHGKITVMPTRRGSGRRRSGPRARQAGVRPSFQS